MNKQAAPLSTELPDWATIGQFNRRWQLWVWTAPRR